MLFPTPFPAGFSFLGWPLNDVNQYVQSAEIPVTLLTPPQPLTLNPAVLLVHPFQSSPVYLPQTPHLDHRLSDKPYTSQFRVYAELCSFRDPSHQIPASTLERYL